MDLAETYSSLLRRVRRRIPVELGNYPYVTARVKAKKALLLRKDAYEKLLQMSIPAIARLLGEGQYAEEMAALGARYGGVDLIEMATRDNLATVFTRLIGFSEGELKEMVARFLDRWDVWNVKTILRGKLYGASPEEILEDVIPAGSFPASFLEELARRETVAEVAEALQETRYGPFLAGLATGAEEVRDLASFEDLLDKAYYEDLLAAVPPATTPTKLFHNFVRTEIDVVNLKTLLRVRGLEEVAKRGVFVSGGRYLAPRKLEALAGMEIPALLERLRKAPFYGVLEPHLQADPPRLTLGIRALERWLLNAAARGANQYPLSVVPVLDFIIAKTKEVENLRIIARGKASGLESNQIRELLVI